MAEITLSTLQNALKRYYPTNEITSQLYNMTPLMAELDKEVTKVENTGEGLIARVPIMTRYNASAGAVSESGVIPTGRAPQYLQLQIGVAYNYGTVEFSGQSLQAAKKNSFVSEIDVKMQGLKTAMEIDLDRQVSNGNGTGMLCMTNGAGGGADATVTVDNPGTQFLMEGMPIYSLDAETAGSATPDLDISQGLTEPTSHIVGAITSDTTFELYDYTNSSIATEKWANNHYLFRYGASDKESMGLKGIVDNYAIRGTSSYFGLGTATQTIHGLDRNTYPILDATVSHNSNVNRALTEKIVLAHLNSIEKQSGQRGKNARRRFFSSYEIQDRFFDEISPDRRFTGDTVNLKGGYSAMYFQYGNEKIPWIVSKMAIPNCLFTLDLNFLKMYQAGMYKWMEQVTGSMFDIKVDSNGRYHIYVATLYNFVGLGCNNFKAQGVIRDISES